MDKNIKAELLYESKALLGEGALWDAQQQLFYWVDIEGLRLQVFDPVTSENTSFTMPSRIGTVVPHQADKVMVALEDGMYTFDRKTQGLETFLQVAHDHPNVRFNDGKCDPSGRFWVGSMDMDCKLPLGKLYRLDADGSLHTMLDSITISNGIVWNRARTKMYYIDTHTQEVAAFDYDDVSGEISNRQVLRHIDTNIGSPDGMTIDENDNLWIGLWNGDGVICVDHNTGETIARIDVPAHNVTACAFGGPARDQLYITTASLDMTEAEQKKYPLAGSLFVARPGVSGLESSAFTRSQ